MNVLLTNISLIIIIIIIVIHFIYRALQWILNDTSQSFKGNNTQNINCSINHTLKSKKPKANELVCTNSFLFIMDTNG